MSMSPDERSRILEMRRAPGLRTPTADMQEPDADAERITEIKARERAATKGPWWTEDGQLIGPPEYDSGFDSILSCCNIDERTLDFIAHARADAPWLLEQLAARDAEIARLSTALAAERERNAPLRMRIKEIQDRADQDQSRLKRESVRHRGCDDFWRETNQMNYSRFRVAEADLAAARAALETSEQTVRVLLPAMDHLRDVHHCRAYARVAVTLRTDDAVRDATTEGER